MSPPPRAGALRRRLVLEAPSEADDEIGGVTRVYVARASLWGLVEALAGGADFAADRAEARVTHRVTVRFRADVTAATRLRLGARVLAIRAVRDPDGGGRTLVCACEEIAT